MKITDFIPPILYRFLAEPSPLKTKKIQIEFYETYGDAQKACTGLGYEDDGLVRVVFEKTRLTKEYMLSGEMPLSEYGTQSLLAVLMAWHQIGDRNKLRVIDYGGACGAHYFQIRPFLPRDIQLDWVVVETPPMVEKAGSFETSELHFADSMREAQERLQNVDLLHSSGTLQYVPDPLKLRFADTKNLIGDREILVNTGLFVERF